MEYPGVILKRGDGYAPGFVHADALRLVQGRISVGRTGKFGPYTEAAVKAFQGAHGIHAGGMVGPQTWGALFVHTLAPGALDTALRFTLREEGGYVHDPRDPGGATNQGVTTAVYRRFRAHEGQSEQSVRWISAAEVRAIYEQEYWEPAGCPAMGLPLAVAAFDLAVNGGLGRLRRLMEHVPRHGVPLQEAEDLCGLRVAWYRSLHNARYEHGWLNRVYALRRYIAGLPE